MGLWLKKMNPIERVIGRKARGLQMEETGCKCQTYFQFSSVESLSHVWLSVTPWTAARQASLSIASSWTWLKLMSIESVMPSSHLILSSPSCPAFNLPQHQGEDFQSQFFTPGGQSIGVSATTSVLPMSIQDWFPLGWTGWISLQSKGLSRVFSIQKQQFFSAQLSL